MTDLQNQHILYIHYKGFTMDDLLESINELFATSRGHVDFVTLDEAVEALIFQYEEVVLERNNLHRAVAFHKRELEQTLQSALYDFLTMCGNRMKCDKILPAEITISQESGDPLSIIMFDIDYFKRFNDTYGHSLGDDVLRIFGFLLNNNVRSTDTTIRWGGEEFLIIAPNTTLNEAVTLANKIRIKLAEKDVIIRETKQNVGSFTISGGVAQRQPDDDYLSLIDRADTAMYTAKRTGRNQIKDENEITFMKGITT